MVFQNVPDAGLLGVQRTVGNKQQNISFKCKFALLLSRFAVKTDLGEMWLVETKGQESLEVKYKDMADQLWWQNTTILTDQQ